MLILSFGWTWPAVASRSKSVTRRSWKPRQLELHQKAFDRGELIQAWTKVPHAKGEQFGIIKYTKRPYLEPLRLMPFTDYEAEGFKFFNSYPRLLPRAAEKRVWAKNNCSRDSFEMWRWQETETVMTVLRFEIVELFDPKKKV